MLGVVIGVFAVVSLVSLGKGLENFITDEFEDIGANLIFVSPGTGDFTGDPASSYTRNKSGFRRNKKKPYFNRKRKTRKTF